MGRLRHFSARLRRGHAPRVEFEIDGVSLLDLVREAELPFASTEGVPALAGNYVWPRVSMRLIHLLADDGAEFSSREGVLLNCQCGMPTCWPLGIRVEMRGTTVYWTELHQAKRRGADGSVWRYSGLGELRFDRRSYASAIEGVRYGINAHANPGVRSVFPPRSGVSKAPGGQRPLRKPSPPERFG